MRAVQVTRLAGPAALEVSDVPTPDDPDKVLIEVRAAGVSFPDLLLSQGLYQVKPEPPFIPGAEVAGVVRSAPAGAPFAVGDRVAAFPGLGGFAEVVAADPGTVFSLPDGVEFPAGAALPMNYLTVHFALCRRGGLVAGDWVLVHGAGGGVGTAAIQLAAALGAQVVAVVSSDTKADAARAAGAHHVVTAADFRQQVAALTQGRGVDVVVDPVGGDRFTDSLRCLAPEGRLLVVGFAAGEIPTVRVNRLLLTNVAVVGVGWGAFWGARPGYLAQQWGELAPLLERGELAPLLGSRYPLAQAAVALVEMQQRRTVGKTVLLP